jgi:crossover junction endodeoxyribonuclease RuvC
MYERHSVSGAIPVVSVAYTLFLDLGTTTGWALGTLDNSTGEVQFLSGVWNLKTDKFASLGARMAELERKLNSLQASSGFQTLAFEAVRAHKGVDAAHYYGGFLGTVQQFCEDRGISYEGVPVGAIKKFATGKGNASKDMMLDAARDKYQMTIDSHDQADAVHGLHLVLNR